MKAKEYLSKYLLCEGRINAKEEKLLELKSKAVSLSTNLSEKVSSTKQVSGTEKIISLYLDMENDIIDELENLKKLQKDIISLIKSACTSDELELLERKYINGKSFSYISEKMCICERQIYRIHGKALEKIQIFLDNNLI